MAKRTLQKLEQHGWERMSNLTYNREIMLTGYHLFRELAMLFKLKTINNASEYLQRGIETVIDV